MHQVLIVEDEEIIRSGIIHSVDRNSLGCQTPLEADNGKKGLELIIRRKPDIVLSDVKMPYMNGLEMIKAAAENDCFFESILISAYDDFSYAQQAIRLNVSEYLLKPINTEQLIEAVKHLCDKIEKQKEITNIEQSYKQNDDTENNPDKCISFSEIEEKIKLLSRHSRRMVMYVKEHYDEHINLQEISEKYEISTAHISREFKKSMGMTFNEFSNRYRIQKALELMKNSNYHVYEVAQMCGFSDYKYFISVFHKYLDCTPSVYMNKHIK